VPFRALHEILLVDAVDRPHINRAAGGVDGLDEPFQLELIEAQKAASLLGSRASRDVAVCE
jgi:hypothetical protein